MEEEVTRQKEGFVPWAGCQMQPCAKGEEPWEDFCRGRKCRGAVISAPISPTCTAQGLEGLPVPWSSAWAWSGHILRWLC